MQGLLKHLLYGWLVCAFSAQALVKPDLAPQELNWIKEHPTVTYTVKDVWPQEYHKGDQHLGLSRDFLDDIEKQTGLRFIYIPPEQTGMNKPMMNSSIAESLLTPAQRQGWLYTSEWMGAIPMLITRNDTIHTRTLAEMAGKKIAVIKGGEYESWLQAHYPAIQLIGMDKVTDILQAVDNNQVDAALGSGLIMLPVYQRLYSHTLAIASQVPEMATGITMAVAPQYPELLSILNQSLAAMSARDVHNAYLKWFGMVEVGSPTLGVLLYYYWWQIILFTTLFVLLILAVRSALRAKRKAQRSEADKSAFLAMMSHEIRTPMNALIASLELLRHAPQQEKRQQYTELAFSSSQNLLELLNNVLDHSKLSQKRQVLERHSFDIGELLEVVCESQRPAAEYRGLTLNLVMPSTLKGYWIIADSHRLRQIVNNLLSNAIKFTPQGSVTLQAGVTQTSSGQLNMHIRVTDTGIGIPLKAQKLLFKAWQQADSSNARQYGGSGLGLYICHQLVSLMQGELELRSKPGEGAEFSFSIPVEPYQSGSVIPSAPERPLPQFGHKISLLVVEDHPANQQVIAGQLEAMACLYEMTAGGEEAMQLLEEENYYHLILLDCNLPGRDGYQVARDIREFEQLQQRDRTPIVAISALNNGEHFRRCTESGMDGVMTKPIRLQELAEVLKKWCPSAEITPESATDLQVEEVSTGVSDAGTDALQLAAWLLQDADAFSRSAEAQDLRYLIHSIHRIKGVAQMYRLVRLAGFAAGVEENLRSSENPADWPLAEWAEQLHALIRAEAKTSP